ncbi:hypothetical protein LVJ83_00675 [Uruburuella testudinis]|uniref:Primase-like protein n=1 Tax=Uruburuella testudinis TaxID=1282863 RepID=A0ABY4DZA5_9NEIS|nr:hypothetical protein [Uruburuella testudinis]UOO82026.1 hypothetical protein LVJ83_00675 [Uruburuella testudinis]
MRQQDLHRDAFNVRQDGSIERVRTMFHKLGCADGALFAFAQGGQSKGAMRPLSANGQTISIRTEAKRETYISQIYDIKKASELLDNTRHQHLLVAAWTLPADILVLDFDDKPGALGAKMWPDVAAACEGCFIERSRSGKGWHVWAKVDTDTGERIAAGRGNGRLKCHFRGFGVDVDFRDTRTAWMGVTGAVYPDGANWETLNGKPKNKQAFEALLAELGLFGEGRMTEVAGRTTEVISRGDEDIGLTDADEIMRLMRQNNSLKDPEGKTVQGGLIRLMDGDIEAVEQFCAGDWSAADGKLCFQISYFTRDFDTILDVASACGLTKRLQHPDSTKRSKWQRDDYVNRTIDMAIRQRQANGQTYQNRKGGKATLAGAVAAGTADYADKLLVRKVGRGGNAVLVPEPCLANVVTALEHDARLAGVFGTDELRLLTVALSQPEGVPAERFPLGVIENIHLSTVQRMLERSGIRPLTQGVVRQGVELVARDRMFNPLKERMTTATEVWDGIDRFDAEYLIPQTN